MIFTVCKQYIKFSIGIENNALSTPLIREYKTYWSFVGLGTYCKPGIVTGNRPLNSAKPNIAFVNACIEGSTML